MAFINLDEEEVKFGNRHESGAAPAAVADQSADPIGPKSVAFHYDVLRKAIDRVF
jgi:hypothetical protein